VIAIVTDSTACLTRKEAASYGVRIVPQTYTVDGKIYKETYADTFTNFIPLINTKISVSETAQPEVSDFYDAFSQLFKKGYDILCVTISSKLSSAYYNAVLAKKQLGCGKVEVIDSGLAAGGVYLLIKRARHLALMGMSLQEVTGGIYKYIPSVSVRFSVDDLTDLRRSHRLVSVRKSIEAVFNQKPLLHLSGGAIIAEEASPVSVDRIKRMFAGIPKNAANMIIHYITPSQRTDLVCRLARHLFPDIAVERRQLGPVLGIHLGCSVIGIVWSI
jgi:DegV family protein with EDD domain